MCKYFYLLLFAVVFNFSHAQTQNNTSKRINKALIKAKKENKHVFVNYLSTSCKQSKKMKEQMENSLFELDYVVVNIEVTKEETSQYLNCSNPMKSFGEIKCEKIEFPFWNILDTNGNFIAVSMKDGNRNIGYPVTKKDVDEFVEILQNTSKLTELNLNTIAESFHKKNNEKLYSIK